AAMVTVQRDLFSSGPGLFKLHFSFPEPAYSGLYESFYGIRPVFNAEANRAVTSTSVLMESLPQANELALKAAEEQCRILLDRHRSRVGLAANVRDRLARSGTQMPGMEFVARDLGMTERTLRRRLLDEGTTFLKLRDEVRLALAEELLTEFALSVELVSERLCYSDPTCFINAFKRWTGKTPHAYRKEAVVDKASRYLQ
ncbi:MAG: AraC family transcriptional regulator, partial [Gammaproteobacteria bacterium]|nr:AraC family transcriptional regulator [Gammaproteobacteria bacterium]